MPCEIGCFQFYALYDVEVHLGRLQHLIQDSSDLIEKGLTFEALKLEKGRVPMPGKVASSTSGHFPAAQCAGSRPHLAARLQEGEKYQNIHIKPGSSGSPGKLLEETMLHHRLFLMVVAILSFSSIPSTGCFAEPTIYGFWQLSEKSEQGLFVKGPSSAEMIVFAEGTIELDMINGVRMLRSACDFGDHEISITNTKQKFTYSIKNNQLLLSSTSGKLFVYNHLTDSDAIATLKFDPRK